MAGRASWTVYIPEPKSGKVIDDRTYATLRARRVIDILCRSDGAPARREWRAINVFSPPDLSRALKRAAPQREVERVLRA